MRKRFTKIICGAVAVISALTLMLAPACGANKWKGVSEKDTATEAVEGTNGGFLVETDGYVYFINGKAANTDDNTFGSVLKGSVQRIKKTELDACNYGNTETVVPSVIYSGNYEAGLYIYGGYIYYATPSTAKNTDGEILNTHLDFKRTKLDGTGTTEEYFWQSTDNAVNYRYVQVDGTVYIMYALSENLYGTSVTNIHSVNCSTGENTLVAYNVSSYSFDTEDPENPYVYYTMDVTKFLGTENSVKAGYNQLYRARADVKTSPREYDFSDVDGYDASENPLYINYGDYVFDGIGKKDNQTEGNVTQFNYAHWSGKTYTLNNSDYTYAIKWFKDGKLYFTRTGGTGSSSGSLYVLEDKDIVSGWDAVEANAALEPLIYGADGTEYEFVTVNDTLYSLNASSEGIKRGEVKDGKIENEIVISSDASATLLDIREENTSATVKNTYLYYSMTGGNGYTFYRLAIDGTEDDYKKLPSEPVWDTTWTYRGVKILDLDTCSDWYAPEFVGNKLFFASETTGMTSYNYVMVCDLAENGYVRSNSSFHALSEKFEGVTEKIEKYDEEKNADGSSAYENLSSALKYLYNTGDSEYLDELIKAYVDIEGRDKEYYYSERSAEIYREFANAQGDWAEYAEDYKTINGRKVYANSREYYYGVVGKMTESDATAMRDGYRKDFMKSYPSVDESWWESIGTGGRVGFIIGMCACGLLLCGGAVLAVVLIKRKKNASENGEEHIDIDITDDKSLNVYEDGENEEKKD